MEGVYLVGGAVRDLLLGRAPRELDVVVEGDVDALATRLAAGGEHVAHERFGTATVRDGDCCWDLASARGETYARPGALPDVFGAGIEQDLQRRDVTINAIALDLAGGELCAAPHAHEDLRGGRLRVLHDASFTDDPTRLWRDRALRRAAGVRPGGAHGGARRARPCRRARSQTVIGCADRQRAAARARRARPVGALESAVGARARAVAGARPRADRARARAAAGRRGAPRPARARRRAAPCPTTTRGSTAWRSRPRSARSCARRCEAPALDDGAARAVGAGARAARAARRGGRARRRSRRRRGPRDAGWTSCATSGCRSPATTCAPRASPRDPSSGGACGRCSTCAWTARSAPDATRSCRRRCGEQPGASTA